jgi:hypothetical protein
VSCRECHGRVVERTVCRIRSASAKFLGSSLYSNSFFFCFVGVGQRPSHVGCWGGGDGHTEVGRGYLFFVGLGGEQVAQLAHGLQGDELVVQLGHGLGDLLGRLREAVHDDGCTVQRGSVTRHRTRITTHDTHDTRARTERGRTYKQCYTAGGREGWGPSCPSCRPGPLCRRRPCRRPRPRLRSR